MLRCLSVVHMELELLLCQALEYCCHRNSIDLSTHGAANEEIRQASLVGLELKGFLTKKLTGFLTNLLIDIAS